MANKFVDIQEVLDLGGLNDGYFTDEEAEAVLRETYGCDYQILSVDGGYVLYDGVSKKVIIEGVSVDLGDIGA